MTRTLIAIALAAMTVAGPVQAAGPVNARQVNQERRIDAGARSGKLNAHEAAQLKAQQNAIKREEARMRARHGGHLTARDKRIIHARQEAANRAILAKKHNAARGKNHLKI